MFTGIVEKIGRVLAIQKGEKSSKITIQAGNIIDGIAVGDSVSTNGVCLTATKIFLDSFQADIMAETLRKSNLGNLKIGSRVNLERAMTPSRRFGGHIVTGHIDDVGIIKKFEKEDNAIWINIGASEKVMKYIIHKGSIAIDGVSLTVAKVNKEGFEVSIIPHTQDETILLEKVIGDTVNLECDILGKYVERLLTYGKEDSSSTESGITMDLLKNNGFL
ncbi:riboflavin synthase [Clostridium cellulovorans]|uniref:Riboflavin synthase n=1 Tax=Clostridium cellulovorans (strain ATCC 35296 / DSM 3052 / OCM 3 / 743B) TaxID=573061 RepID=D9SS94_CLOC7|nr:riboflavin synthase [Clostridium cellulovorans]ADL52541.1 riboflavin synthase, alpha subunit [Clostridium cellulovorans 743B]